MMKETLKRKQNRLITALFTTGIANNAPKPTSSSATKTSTFCWIGSFNFFTMGNVNKPEPTNRITGNAKFSGYFSHSTFGKGRSQPPQKSVTATPEITKILAYRSEEHTSELQSP